ncbi:MAG: hypothetical protein V2B19_11210 [Pseudomonadota bacterium]
MKRITLFVSMLTIFVMVSTTLFAENSRTDDAWRNEYLASLKKGKAVQLPAGQTPAAGLAYTPPEGVVLQEAIAKALEKGKEDRVCECMKMAVDMEYNPYLVIKTIYEAGGDLKIDQLCMCATEAGVMKAIVAKAAKEAVSPLGGPVFAPDEIAQTTCFRGEEGLAFTEATGNAQSGFSQVLVGSSQNTRSSTLNTKGSAIGAYDPTPTGAK